ncbi:TPA: GlxA family transcriptional regulator [Enterobacter cloacae]|uniref:GlxA family transcriptional regulator n=1 Tax=Enterobacter cloacae TaxID=550 RepID=A0A3R8ZZU6_ENTCL|nr:GlxA family transcriptional regulator [Enterobacter cloacae]MBF4114266.1 GlxA family transcriptional regulator [Enterobacter cloacae]RSB21790.1 GlxA family transcriptional regulator [Enterobacter cloacae]
MHEIGLVVYPGFQVLSLSVSSVFEYTNIVREDNAYAFSVVSAHGGPVKTSQGLSIMTDSLLEKKFDTLIVAGDNSSGVASQDLVKLIQDASGGTRRLTSICSGSFILADAGVLSGKSATTHWALAQEFRNRYADINLTEDRIFVVDGNVWTSAGMTAGIDLALALVEDDYGHEVARRVARQLVVYHRRGGGQSQFSALLELDACSDRVQSALAYARANLNNDLTVEALADIARLSPRQFSRIFRDETGQSPAKAVERLRVEAARLMIETSRHPVEVIAREAGFGDRERMRQAFLRAFGQSPQAMMRSLRP